MTVTSDSARSRPGAGRRQVSGADAVRGPLTVPLPIGRIHAHPRNIRQELGDLSELAAAIAAKGLLQPLTVRPHPTKHGQFELLAGHRRWGAARAAGLTQVPAIIRYDAGDELAAVEVMLIENVHRRDLTPMEKAEALGRLRSRGYSNALISARTGIAPSTVSSLLTLLELDETSRDLVRTGQVSAAEAVTAVRQTRRQRKAAARGHGVHDGPAAPGTATQPSPAPRPAVTVREPDHLGSGHPLAGPAGTACAQAGHTTRRRIGGIACGQCWEQAIRADERTAVATGPGRAASIGAAG